MSGCLAFILAVAGDTLGNDRKTPLWRWIVALLIGLPVLYVASFCVREAEH
ncbi:MAG: hypothetical protein ACM3U2_05845 [Deltaproteobacteria bacterium]